MNTSTEMQDLFAFIDSQAEMYLERLKNLCRQQTIAARRQGISEGAARVADLMRGIGADSKLVPVGDTTYAITKVSGSGQKTLGFYNHFDTHPPGNIEDWISPPFEPTVRDENLYARGASDNKGNLVARACAVEAYQHVFGELPISVLFLHDGEEEVGSPHMATFIEKHASLVQDAGAWIWEGGFKDSNEQLEVYLGFNGICYVELEVVTTKEDTHGSHAGLVPNAAWRLVWALSTIKNESEVITIDGFYDRVRPVTDNDRALLKALPINPSRLMDEYEIRQWAGNSLDQDALERQYLCPYINLSGIGAGSQGEGMEVILPHRAKAKLEIYLVPNQDPDQVEDQLRSHFESRGFGDIQVRSLAKMPPVKTSAQSGLARTTVRMIGELYEKPAVLYPLMPGASPMGYLTERFGVPGISTGVGYANSRIHQPNENVRISDFIQGIKLMASLIDQLGRSDQEWT